MRAVPLLPPLAALALLGGAAGVDGPVAAAAESAGPCSAALAAGTRTVSFTSRGARRTARLDTPPAAAGRRVPLIVALHYAGGTGERMAARTHLSAPARRAGFAVAYPTATKADRVWRLREDTDGRADVDLVAALLDGVGNAVCLDARRTFATGVSNGGGMAAKLACALPERFAAVAPVAPGLRAIAPCQRGEPVGVLEIHGLADAVVPYGGRGPARAGSVPRWLARWRLRNGCGAGADVRVTGRRGARITRTTWRGCRAAVARITLEGTGHGWPGSQGGFPRRDPTGLEANGEVLRFFERATGDSS